MRHNCGMMIYIPNERTGHDFKMARGFSPTQYEACACVEKPGNEFGFERYGYLSGLNWAITRLW